MIFKNIIPIPNSNKIKPKYTFAQNISQLKDNFEVIFSSSIHIHDKASNLNLVNIQDHDSATYLTFQNQTTCDEDNRQLLDLDNS